MKRFIALKLERPINVMFFSEVFKSQNYEIQLKKYLPENGLRRIVYFHRRPPHEYIQVLHTRKQNRARVFRMTNRRGFDGKHFFSHAHISQNELALDHGRGGSCGRGSVQKIQTGWKTWRKKINTKSFKYNNNSTEV